MDRHQLRLAALKICVPFLMVFSWVFGSLILQTRPVKKASLEKVEGPVSALSSIARLPASLPSTLPGVFSNSSVATDGPRMELLPISCWDEVQTKVQHQADARWVRLSGKTCQHTFKAESVQVRNLTNGYVGTVFLPDGGQLTTDYIPLESGKNELLLRFDQGEGVHSENIITVQR